ncbi:MAG TPA: hypothetical protein VN426_01850 [Syntrophomonadaceae bacterium]|nr:hypothetical protein [Syntrophomonadaceae bacterium]
MKLYLEKALNRVLVLTLMMVLTAVMAAPAAAATSGWAAVGSAGFSNASVNSCMALDNSGTPYVAFADGSKSNKATVMKYNGSSWAIVGAAGFSAGLANDISIAFDGVGTPYVAYGDVGNSYKATVMRFNGTSWETVGNAGFSANKAYYLSLAIDGSGIPYAAYQDGGNSKKATVMRFNGTSWETVGNAGFSAGLEMYTSLAIDGSGNLYVAYRDYGNSYKATVMKFNGSNWSPLGGAGFSEGTAGYTSLAIYGGTPYVAYCDQNYGGLQAKAVVKKFNGSGWETVGSAGFSAGTASYVSLVFDGSGTPYIAYEDGGNSNKATVMKFNGTDWETVGSAGLSTAAAYYTNLRIDGGGSLYVAYEDGNKGYKLTVMKHAGPVATSITVSGPDSITIPGNGTATGSCTATVKDQYSGVMTGEKVTWSIAPSTGVNIDASGVITVTPSASVGMYTITAKAGSATGSCPVNLGKAASVATTIEVSGSTAITIPSSGTANETYTAVVKDQYGAAMNGEPVTWSINPNTGVSIDAGIVTVTASAESGNYIVTAISGNAIGGCSVAVKEGTTPSGEGGGGESFPILSAIPSYFEQFFNNI